MRRRRQNGISTRLDGATGFVELHGEVDITSVVDIEHASSHLVDAGVECVIYDFTDAEFADSKAIEAIMRAGQSVALAGRAVVAVGASGGVKRAIEVCGLDRAIPVFDTRAEALGAM